MVIDLGKYYDIPTKSIEGLNDTLINVFPGLERHNCSRGYEGGFVERLREGTYLAHVIEHLSIEIQNLLGYDIAYGKAIREDTANLDRGICGYNKELAATEAGRIAVDL